MSKSFRIRAPRVSGGTEVVEKCVLDDLNFDVYKGEVFGIIGRNGAGKSTLLKILSRITPPTKGRITIYGRVTSLLEVGTGMHPEMTGRENVFLNGSLLGMSKPDIARRFDEIVEFSGVREYIDMPIKRYSSGMKLRLAFAVAAHLSADVMIVDEVLAVGDAEFQSKCLGAMQEGVKSGRTTLFVSHNMGAIENLCSRVAWLHDGKIAELGDSGDVVKAYLGAVTSGLSAERVFPDSGPQHASLAVRIVKAAVAGVDGNVPVQGDDVVVDVKFEVRRKIRGLQLQVRISTLEGQLICVTSNGDYREAWNLEPGTYEMRARFSSVRLLPRIHRISLISFVKGAEAFENLVDALTFQVFGRDVLGTGVSLLADRGVTWMPVRYELSKVGESADEIARPSAARS